LTAIDGCVDVEGLGSEEPTCSRPNMDCPSGGGTIMSYCSISDDVECTIVNKWHPQVATYIKGRYDEGNSMECFGIDACADNGGDADGDGICAANDCDDNDASVGAMQTVGTACDDGDAMTENDVIQSDGCGCAGTAIVNEEACASPENLVITGISDRAVNVTWASIPDALSYTMQVRLAGQERWLITATLLSNEVNLYGPRRDFELRIKSNCAEEASEYSSIQGFSIPTSTLISEVATSRDNDIQEIFLQEAANLYPNPVKNTLNLVFPTAATQTQFIIYDIAGKEVYRQKMEGDTDNYAFNLDHLEAGFYLGVVQENGKMSYAEKFVKQ